MLSRDNRGNDALMIAVNSGLSSHELEEALSAVLEKCAALRVGDEGKPSSVGWIFASLFEWVISDALDINLGTVAPSGDGEVKA
jgi:hypothetical protein